MNDEVKKKISLIDELPFSIFSVTIFATATAFGIKFPFANNIIILLDDSCVRTSNALVITDSSLSLIHI